MWHKRHAITRSSSQSTASNTALVGQNRQCVRPTQRAAQCRFEADGAETLLRGITNLEGTKLIAIKQMKCRWISTALTKRKLSCSQVRKHSQAENLQVAIKCQAHPHARNNILSTNYLPKRNRILADNTTVKEKDLYSNLCGNPSVLYLAWRMSPMKADRPEQRMVIDNARPPGIHQTELFLSN
jgi:hypothetical protein